MGRIIYSAGGHSGRVANHMKTGVLAKYKNFLPVTSKTPLFSLGEGDTALKNAEPFLELPADLVAVEQALGWG